MTNKHPGGRLQAETLCTALNECQRLSDDLIINQLKNAEGREHKDHILSVNCGVLMAKQAIERHLDKSKA